MAVQPQRFESRTLSRSPGSIPRQMASQPTAEQRENAQRLAETHRRICVPEAVCKHCLRSWPCAASRWAELVLLKVSEAEQSPHRGRH